MATQLVLSLPDDLVESVLEAVARGEAESVAAWAAEAIAQRDHQTRLVNLLATWDNQNGVLTPAELAWARQQLGLPSL